MGKGRGWERRRQKGGNEGWEERAERREREEGEQGGVDHTHPCSSSKSSLLGRWKVWRWRWEVGLFLPSDTSGQKTKPAKASKTQFHQERPFGDPGT